MGRWNLKGITIEAVGLQMGVGAMAVGGVAQEEPPEWVGDPVAHEA